MPNHDLSHHLPEERRKEGYTLNSVQTTGSGGPSRKYLRVELRHQGKHAGSVDDWVGRDGPTGKQGRETLPDPKEHPKARQLSDAMRAAFTAHASTLHKGCEGNKKPEPVIKRDPAAPAPTPKPPKVGSLPKPPKPPKPKATQAGVSMTSVTMKSEPTAILDAARVDAEVERRLAEIEGAREGLSKNDIKQDEHKELGDLLALHGYDRKHADVLHAEGMGPHELKGRLAIGSGKVGSLEYTHNIHKTVPVSKSESDHVKEFVLGLDLGGTRRWHSACVSKDDSNLGKAIKGKQADRTYSREGSRGVQGVCTGCGGELQLDPAPREVDAPVHGEDHNEHKIEKGEKMSNEEVRGHLQQLQQRADEHQKNGRKADADAMRVKIRQIKEKHGMGPEGKSALSKDEDLSKADIGRFQSMAAEASAKANASSAKADSRKPGQRDADGRQTMAYHAQAAEDHNRAATLHRVLARHGNEESAVKAKEHETMAAMHRSKNPSDSSNMQKSELLAGARFHYARVVRFQQLLGKSEDAAEQAGKAASMCALYVAKMGGDPAKGVPAEVRDCGPVNLTKGSFHLDREVRGLPAKTLPLIKATVPNFGSSLPEEEQKRDETPIHGHRQLGERLMSWHSSASDPIYGTGSTFFAGKPVPKWQVQATLDNISKLHREAQTPAGAERGGWGPADVRELGGIKNHLTRLLKSSLPEEEQKRDETPIHGHRQLGERLMSWHSSASDPIYGTGSTFFAGKPVPKWQVQATLDNISKLHREAQTPAGAERGGWGPADVRELGGIKNHLTRLLKTPSPVQKTLTGAPGDTAPGATIDGGALQLAEKGMPRTMPHPETGKGGGKTDTRYSIGRSYTGHASGKPQYVVQFANERIGQHETREGAEALARQHAAKRNADLGFTQKSEKSDVGHVGKDGGKGGSKALDIGDGYYVHSHGNDANGNHSVWVSKGANRARKIQTNGNLPSVHSEVGRGDKGKLTITKKGAEEIKDYHRQYHEKPVKKAEPCAPAGSPLQKLNAMIKSASSGASLSKAARPIRQPD